MALQTINLGTYANDGTGDDLRTAFQKVNSNLTELYGALYGANVGATPPTSGVEEGELWWSTIDGRMYIRYGSSWVETSPPTAPISYDLSAETATNGANLKLSGSDLTVDTVKFAAGTNITVSRIDVDTIEISSESYSGNMAGTLTGSLIGNVTGNVTGELFGNSNGLHTGNVIGNVTGNITGNVTGNSTTVTNGVYTTSSINELADVDTASTPPTTNQALLWNGIAWTPGSVSTTGGGDLDFGSFASPAGFTLDLGTF